MTHLEAPRVVVNALASVRRRRPARTQEAIVPAMELPSLTVVPLPAIILLRVLVAISIAKAPCVLLLIPPALASLIPVIVPVASVKAGLQSEYRESEDRRDSSLCTHFSVQLLSCLL